MKIGQSVILIFTLLFVACGGKSTDQMVFVEGGSFCMGTNEQGSDSDEQELRLVTVNDFYISKFEVTQAEWVAIMDYNPSCFHGNDLPVESVSWDDVQLFIKRLNEKTGRSFRLPTQDEWEYAARGGKFANGGCMSSLYRLRTKSWMKDNSEETTHKVGMLEPNALGLYDMIGNVHEWCNGLYDSVCYARDSVMNRKYDYVNIRVFKGGCWASDSIHCRISNINYNSRETRNFTIGFRLVEDVTKNK